MSSREKSAWICLVATLIVFAAYFFYVLQLFERGELRTPAAIPALVGAIFLQAVINAAAAMAAGTRAARESKTERDAAVEARSFRIAYGVLASTLVAAVAVAMLLIPASPVASYALALMAQFALVAFAAGEAARYVVQVVAYRRG